jgi:hypothetical protein|tara:strand:- start:515 stop:724 length:210 start_codon:yes stop_codon:yes gene_type:complete
MFSSYYYDSVYKVLRYENNPIRLKHLRKLVLSSNLDFERNMPTRYVDKIKVVEIDGEKYVYAVDGESKK